MTVMVVEVDCNNISSDENIENSNDNNSSWARTQGKRENLEEAFSFWVVLKNASQCRSLEFFYY